MADEDTERSRLKFCEKLFANGMRRRRLTMQQYVCNMFRLRWDENSQCSSFSLAGCSIH